MADSTVQQSGGDFTTLAAALADAGTGAGDTITIQGAWTVDDTAAATVADDNITITADSDSQVDPTNIVASPSHYRLRHSGGSHCITVNNTGCVIEKIEVQQGTSGGSGSSDEGFRIAAASTTIRRCVIYAAQQQSDQDGIYLDDDADRTVVVENCILWGWNRCGIHIQSLTFGSTFNLDVNSSFIYDCGHEAEASKNPSGGIGVSRGGNSGPVFNVNCFNSVVIGNDNATAAADFNEEDTEGTMTWNIDYCIDGDGSSSLDSGAVGTLTSHNITDDNTKSSDGDWVIVGDITSSLYDLTLQSNAFNEAQDMHSSGSGAGLSIPATDIVGTSRATAYECGAFTIPAAGGTTRRAQLMAMGVS